MGEREDGGREKGEKKQGNGKGKVWDGGEKEDNKRET